MGVGSGDFLPRTVKNQIPQKPELKMLGVRINIATSQYLHPWSPVFMHDPLS